MVLLQYIIMKYYVVWGILGQIVEYIMAKNEIGVGFGELLGYLGLGRL